MISALIVGLALGALLVGRWAVPRLEQLEEEVDRALGRETARAEALAEGRSITLDEVRRDRRAMQMEVETGADWLAGFGDGSAWAFTVGLRTLQAAGLDVAKSEVTFQFATEEGGEHTPEQLNEVAYRSYQRALAEVLANPTEPEG